MTYTPLILCFKNTIVVLIISSLKENIIIIMYYPLPFTTCHIDEL